MKNDKCIVLLRTQSFFPTKYSNGIKVLYFLSARNLALTLAERKNEPFL